MNVEVSYYSKKLYIKEFEGDPLRDIDAIISELEQQRAAIERAISALREITGGAVRIPAPSKAPTAKKKRRISPAGLRRIIAANKRRWAAIKKADQSTPASNRMAATKKSSSKRHSSKKAAKKASSAAEA
jgi:hypothetical protein